MVNGQQTIIPLLRILFYPTAVVKFKPESAGILICRPLRLKPAINDYTSPNMRSKVCDGRMMASVFSGSVKK